MPFDFKNKDRLSNLVYELAGLRYMDIQNIEGFSLYEDDGTVGKKQPESKKIKEVEIGWRWSGYDVYNWLETDITVPPKQNGARIAAIFDFGTEPGSGNNSHFESLLYINGSVHQAVDGNHREVFLDDMEGRLNLRFRLWSGLNGGGKPAKMDMQIKTAKLVYLNIAADKLYFFARNILDAYANLETADPQKEWMLNQLVQAFRLVDYTNPQSQAFYRSVAVALAYLEKNMKGQGKPDVWVSLIGHTHIDLAWLWRLRHTREKAARSFSTVNRLMQNYPDYVFLQSQAQLYSYIKEDYPEIYANIQRHVKEGRWEPSGAMWVECDCNVPSGESLVRQILVGKNYFKTEFNYDNDFLWLPDVFGYSWALPQILKKSGINTFVTSKISWNDTNKLPYDTFMWRGLDGSEILTHFITTGDQDYKTNAGSFYTYNGNTRPYSIQGAWYNYKNKDLNRDLFVPYGYGDGGGGPTRDMLESMQSLNKIPGIPYVRAESVSKTLKRIHKNIKENKLNGFLPTWDGELYLEFHRGTYTSQAHNKKMNRRLEFMLRDTEILSVFSSLLNETSAYNKSAILEAWKILLRNQFHDILPGSSIHEVYEDSRIEYAQGETMLQKLQAAAISPFMKKTKNAYTFFNSGSFVRNSYVQLPDDAQDIDYYNEKGSLLDRAYINGRLNVLLTDMPPCAMYSIHTRAPAVQENASPAREALKTDALKNTDKAESPFYILEWNKSGQIIRLYDKTNHREVFAKGDRGNVLQIFEDKPRCFDAWELESTIDDKKEEISNLTSVKVEETALALVVSFTWLYNKSTISQTLHLYTKNPRIDFKTSVDWHETQKILKTAFSPEIRSTQARFDIQYGNILRPITANTSWEAAKFEVCAHKWADFSETDYGFAVLNDCKYGHDIKNNTVRLSLLKSAVNPDYSADIGSHKFTYSILPHSGTFIDAKLEEQAFDLNNPMKPVSGSAKITDSFVEFSNSNVFLDCIKQTENDTLILLRFHEYAGSRGKVEVYPIKTADTRNYQWCEADLMEVPITKWKSGKIQLFVRPYEIKTILLKTGNEAKENG